MQVSIREYTATHDLVVITTRKGYSYATTWAKSPDSPTKEEVKKAWKENRKHFDSWYGSFS